VWTPRSGMPEGAPEPDAAQAGSAKVRLAGFCTSLAFRSAPNLHAPKQSVTLLSVNLRGCVHTAAPCPPADFPSSCALASGGCTCAHGVMDVVHRSSM
jgi:hypothetical protein